MDSTAITSSTTDTTASTIDASDQPARQTDRADVDRIYRAYGAKVRRWARRLARFSCDADDIVQEVFLAVYRRPEMLNAVTRPGPWLLKVTSNIARHFWRAQGRQVHRERSWELAFPTRVPADPLEELEAKRVARQINEVLSSLDAQSAEIYRLSEVERLPTTTIAALTGLRPATLRVRRFRTRSVIAERLALSGATDAVA